MAGCSVRRSRHLRAPVAEHMTLLSQTVGVVAAAVALSAVFTGRISRRHVPGAAAAVVVVVLSLLFWANLWRVGKGFEDARAHNSAVRGDAAAVAGGTSLGVDVTFIDWARRRIPGEDTYYVMPRGIAGPSDVYQWLTYQMFPHLSAESPEDADWLIFYDVEPDDALDRTEFKPAQTFAPRFAIARRR